VVEHVCELVDGVRAERVSNLWSVECDSSDAAVDRQVIRDVTEVLKSGHIAPQPGIEEFTHVCGHALRL
jgi:hypothetical protein